MLGRRPTLRIFTINRSWEASTSPGTDLRYSKFSPFPTRSSLLRDPSKPPDRRGLPPFTMASGGDARLMKSTKFPPEFNQKVDMQKVNVQVVKKLVKPFPSAVLQVPKTHRSNLLLACRWIASRISEILGNDDDVVIELVFNLIEGARNVHLPSPPPKSTLHKVLTSLSPTSNRYKYSSPAFSKRTRLHSARSCGSCY